MKKHGQQTKIHQITIGECSEVQFVPHAMSRLAQRGIKESDVISALENPKKKKTSADFPHKGITWKKSATKTLCVIYDVDGKRLTVITAYWK